MYKIIIPSASAANLLPCVNSILKHEPDLDQKDIIIIDDGAGEIAQPHLPGITWLKGVKPFIFSRNVNIGLHAAGSNDIIMLNDDTLLETQGGLSKMHHETLRHPETGICSAAITGFIGNHRQMPGKGINFRLENETLAFVCVCIPNATIERIGYLDEQFDGYGYDDNDYCQRVKNAGYSLAIWDGCIINHGHLKPTYRSRSDFNTISIHNKNLYHNKWNVKKSILRKSHMKKNNCIGRADCMYTAWNRLEFTKASFSTLLVSTEWNLINELFVYDDGSTDGTREWLSAAISKIPVKTRFITDHFGSPVTAMSDFIDKATASILAKLDNDAIYPEKWLSIALKVMDEHPELQMLGLEAMYQVESDLSVPRTYTRAQFISGLGLYRKSCFNKSKPVQMNKYFGLEEWQMAKGESFITGWITPSLPVFLLDRLPIKPWVDYSDNYIAQGWQRPWQRYNINCSLWNWWIPRIEEIKLIATPISSSSVENASVPDLAFKVVIPSASSTNIIACVSSILNNEPDLSPEDIIIVDDGARKNAAEAIPGVTWVDGKKPFVYTQNVNIGIVAAGKKNVILMNDDAQLLTPGGLSSLCRKTLENSKIGACTTAINGIVCNERQKYKHNIISLRYEPEMLSFICVCIPSIIIQNVGLLDEHFDGYGYDDNDYCRRIKEAGHSLGIWDGCIVDHSGSIPSTFRSKSNCIDMLRKNQRYYDMKWNKKKSFEVVNSKNEKIKNNPFVSKTTTMSVLSFLCAMRVKNEAAYIEEALQRALKLCEIAYVFDDNSTDETRSICSKFGERVRVIQSHFEGFDESRDKNYLLEEIIKVNPDWVFWIDGDEVLEHTGAEIIRNEIQRFPNTGSFSLRIAYLWDSAERVRVDGIYGTFSRPSLFRLKGQKGPQLKFINTCSFGNLHCGNIPKGLQGPQRSINIRLKHYGYISKSKRQEKYMWYTKNDPDNQLEDNYRHLVEIPGARFAPGPSIIVPWQE